MLSQPGPSPQKYTLPAPAIAVPYDHGLLKPIGFPQYGRLLNPLYVGGSVWVGWVAPVDQP